MPRDSRAEETRAERRERRILGGGQLKMVSEKEPGWHYRYVNDKGSRIPDALDAGYEVVRGETQRAFDPQTGTVKSMTGDSVVSMVVDKANGQRAVLLRKRQEWHEEDQAAKQSALDETDRQIEDATLTSGQIADPHMQYVPKGNPIVYRR